MAGQIRIKLDKFVASKEQRIFKTKTAFIDELELYKLNRYLNFYFNQYNILSGKSQFTISNVIPLDVELDFPFDGEFSITYDEYDFFGRSDVYHAEYNFEKLKIAEGNNSELISGDMINFHDINMKYLTENPEKQTNLYIDRYGKSVVSYTSRFSAIKYYKK